MIITKKYLPRRTFLRNVLGTSIALPFLDAMVPALTAQSKTAAKPSFRFGAIYSPNGMLPSQWKPDKEGTDFAFAPIMKPLEPLREYVTVLSGLYQTHPGSVHVTASAMWLNGVVPKKTEAEDVSEGITIDQYIAAKIGRDTFLPSIEFGVEDMHASIGSCDSGYSCLYMSTLSWRTPTAPLPVEINPRVMFERLFGDTGVSAGGKARLRLKNSILDSVVQETAHLEKNLGSRDRTRLAEYLDSIREVEVRMQKAEAQALKQDQSKLELPGAPTAGETYVYGDHVKLLLDLQLLAYRADITRVFTFMMAHEASLIAYPQIGVPEAHHDISHHGNRPENTGKYALISTYHNQLVGDFLQKMRDTNDGDGSLLDHSVIMFGCGMSDGNGHSRENLPIVLAGKAGGQIKGGEHIHYATKTPLSNLLVTLGQKAGLELDHIGESTGKLDL